MATLGHVLEVNKELCKLCNRKALTNTVECENCENVLHCCDLKNIPVTQDKAICCEDNYTDALGTETLDGKIAQLKLETKEKTELTEIKEKITTKTNTNNKENNSTYQQAAPAAPKTNTHKTDDRQKTNVNKNKINNHETKINTGLKITGSAKPEENIVFKATEKKEWIYVGRARPETTEKHIKDYLISKFPNENFEISEIKKHESSTSKNKSFKIGMQYSIKDEVLKPEIWPENLIIKKFWFFRPDYKKQ
ncbi:unnamed protein product [Brassicogethes aeneus]|uniref:Uncharacterized protein n=1 Tax=Brassicogethes aeneus TaxID=1431903 RepID=A0A9P0B156_BRAAE|nr:unnamed protein product [Brassicogethes aeneus]